MIDLINCNSDLVVSIDRRDSSLLTKSERDIAERKCDIPKKSYILGTWHPWKELDEIIYF